MSDYRVSAPLVILSDANGADVYLYRGAQLTSQDVKDRQDLLDSKMIVTAAEYDKVDAKTDPGGNVVDESADAGTSGDGLGADGTPTSRANKAQLVEYAVAQGMPQEEAEGMTKAQLADKYVS